MAYKDTFFSREHRYSLGVEEDTGRHYLAIPVGNGPFDYEERYAITPGRYRELLGSTSTAVDFAESCRRRERDELLIGKPGWNRGTPV